MTDADLRENWFDKIKTLNERVWESKADRPAIDAWLDNFADDWNTNPSERLHALYLLSHFMYFGDAEVRVLLKALFRDLFRYPIIEEIRQDVEGTLDATALQATFATELRRSRFLGLGNPAESGTHLLYFFRQENELTKDLFIHSHQIFDGRMDSGTAKLNDSNVKRYILIDDFCGSGDQAIEYSDKVAVAIRSAGERDGVSVEICYYVLFSTTKALDRVRADGRFDRIGAVYELDDSYRAFDDESRYFRTNPASIDRDFAHRVCEARGSTLWPLFPLGYRDGQLLIGFHHNTPDNTLPVMWFDESPNWTPMFRRYHKV